MIKNTFKLLGHTLYRFSFDLPDNAFRSPLLVPAYLWDGLEMVNFPRLPPWTLYYLYLP